jgi:hypothetical protein
VNAAPTFAPALQNRTLAETAPGDTAGGSRRVAGDDADLYALVSGDANPPDAGLMLGVGPISGLIFARLPAPGAICLREDLRLLRPIRLGHAVTATVAVAAKEPASVTLACRRTAADGTVLLQGIALVHAPIERQLSHAGRRGAVQDGGSRPGRGRHAGRATRLRQCWEPGGRGGEGHCLAGGGAADILVVSDLEAGNMVAKQMTFLAGAEAVGVVLGAGVPIILTSRADPARTRLASCAVAVRLARAGGA